MNIKMMIYILYILVRRTVFLPEIDGNNVTKLDVKNIQAAREVSKEEKKRSSGGHLMLSPRE